MAKTMTYEEKLTKIRQLGGDVHYSGDVDSGLKDFWCDCGELYDNHLFVTIIGRGNSVEEAINNCWAELENVKPGQCIYSNGRYVILYKGEWVDIDTAALDE